MFEPPEYVALWECRRTPVRPARRPIEGGIGAPAAEDWAERNSEALLDVLR